MESYRYRDLVEVVTAAQKGIPVSSCVHLFGAGHPAMFALAVAMGCDIFDSAAYALYAKEGRYLTAEGSYRLHEIADLPCPCEVCRRHTASEIQQSPEKERLLALHNLYQTLAEIARVRQAVQDGVLWELVDDRCRGHPQLLRGFRTLLSHAGDLAAFDRVSKRRFFYRGTESCRRTEVLRYQSMLGRFTTGDQVLVAFDGRAATGTGRTLPLQTPVRALSAGAKGDLSYRAERDPRLGRRDGPTGMQGDRDPCEDPSRYQGDRCLRNTLGTDCAKRGPERRGDR